MMRWAGAWLRQEEHTKFSSENLKGRDHSEDIRVDGRITLELILRGLGWEGVYYIHVAQDRDQWRPLVDMEMTLRVHKTRVVS